MAEWEHKESTWHPVHKTKQFIYTLWILNSEGSLERVTFDNKKTDPDEREKIDQIMKSKISFTHWLDAQCDGGWEVFKISRDFNPGRHDFQRTWCVFRRLV